jgi:hypothetical protein
VHARARSDFHFVARSLFCSSSGNGVQVAVTHLSYDVNPFTGKPFFSEVLFCHTPSGVLITADFYWNYPDSLPMKTAIWKFGMDVIFHWFYFQFMIKDQGAIPLRRCDLWGAAHI